MTLAMQERIRHMKHFKALALASIIITSSCNKITTSELLNQSSLAFDSGDYSNSVKLITRALLDPTISTNTLADAYNQRGRAYLKLGDILKAENDFTRAIANNKEPIYLINMAVLLANTDRPNEALACLNIAMQAEDYDELTPEAHSIACEYLGRCRFDLGDYTNALATLNSTDNLSLDGLSLMARIYNITGDNDKSVSIYSQILSVRPSSTKALTGIAEAYEDLGQYSNSLHFYQAGLDVDPTDIVAASGAARLLATTADPNLNNPDEAISIATKALLHAADSSYLPWLHESMASAYAAKGNFTQAIQHQEYAIASSRYDSVRVKMNETLIRYKNDSSTTK